jgi:hypothetical protein
MSDRDSFGRLEKRLQALSATLERETTTLRQRIADWREEEEWLTRQRSTLSSWAAAARRRPLAVKYTEVTDRARGLHRWARSVRSGLRMEYVGLRLRILARDVRRNARPNLRSDMFFVAALSVLALIVLLLVLL